MTLPSWPTCVVLPRMTYQLMYVLTLIALFHQSVLLQMKLCHVLHNSHSVEHNTWCVKLAIVISHQSNYVDNACDMYISW